MQHTLKIKSSLKSFLKKVLKKQFDKSETHSVSLCPYEKRIFLPTYFQRLIFNQPLPIFPYHYSPPPTPKKKFYNLLKGISKKKRIWYRKIYRKFSFGVAMGENKTKGNFFFFHIIWNPNNKSQTLSNLTK